MADHPNSRKSIIFVCTANICRSPMAEGLLKHALGREPKPFCDIPVLSAGTSAYDGDTPSVYSVDVLKSVGIHIEKHKSQFLTQQLVDQAFAIFCMTRTHKLILEHTFKKTLPIHTYLLRQWLAKDQDVKDPFSLGLEDYKACRDGIVEAIPSIISFLKLYYPTTL